MISGDHQKAAQAIADQVGLSEAWGDLMPEDKVEAIKRLRAEGKIAMVGDGVNDAPAMATATVGIAMGAAGSDVALETADVALMSDDLAQLPFAVGLSRGTRRIILQNLIVSLGVVAFLVPATILGLGIGPVNDSFRRNVGLIHKPHVRDQVGVNLPTEPRCTSLSRAAVDPNHGGNLSSIQPSGPHEQFLSARLEVWAEEVLPKAMAQREIWHLASACLSDCLSC